MVSDSITNASSPSAPNARDFGKKKRGNRSAKLKQCKLDARREQWLSQGAVKNKGFKGETNGDREPLRGKRNERDRSLENLETRRRGEENDGSIHHESDTESPSNSPTSTDSGTNFTVSSGGSSSSSICGGCCSGSITEEEEDGGDGCLDDWEAVADALAANDKHESENPCSESPPEREQIVRLDPPRESTNGSGLGARNAKPVCPRMGPGMQGNGRAWRPDDVFRPQSLPNLSKQSSFPTSDRHSGHGRVPWACNSAIAVPSSCPICYEDLDFTDSSFLPCACGFRLCLFCHKRILEEDGRCPGCRKPYEQDHVKMESSVHGGSLTFRLARSCSMV